MFHSADLPFVFNSRSLWEPEAPEADDAKTAAAVGERWMRFAIEGNPDPSWTPYTRAKPSWLAFDRAGKVSNEDLSWFEKEKFELVFAGLRRARAKSSSASRMSEDALLAVESGSVLVELYATS